MEGFKADLVARGKSGEVVAVIELKSRVGVTADFAEVVRSQVAGRVRLDAIPYLLLITQDRGFLWQQQAGSRAVR
jgi:hypothetical protein